MTIADDIEAQRRADSWMNLVTGVGTARDKSASTSFVFNPPKTPEFYGMLFAGDSFARRIVCSLPDDAFRPGFNITRTGAGVKAKSKAKPAPGQPGAPRADLADPTDPAKKPEANKPTAPDVDPMEVQDQARQIVDRLQALRAVQRLKEAAIWGRVYGHGACVIGTNSAPTGPLPDRAQIKYLTPLTARDLQAIRYYEDPMRPDFGEPELFRLQRVGSNLGQAAGRSVQVHETRLVQFRGVLTPPELKSYYQGRDFPVLHVVEEILTQTNSNWGSICAMLGDMSQGVIKLKGLINGITAGKGETFQKRVELMDAARSAARVLLLDAEMEEYSMVERQALTGVADLVDKTFLRLAAAVPMPVSRLLGQAPAGLNATGEGDRIWWYDQVRAYQRDELTPGILVVVKLVGAELFPEVDPETWRIEWNPLEELTAHETADLREKVAQTDKLYIDTQVLTPAEVAMSRFGRGEWSPDYHIDLEARRELLAVQIDEMINPPEPSAPVLPGGVPGGDPAQPGGPPKPKGTGMPPGRPTEPAK